MIFKNFFNKKSIYINIILWNNKIKKNTLKKILLKNQKSC